ncbi:MAG: hypothetical protein BEU03_01455 [Marine Group III euryarchaeote CG-Epi6]|uniref:dolichyl-phosphooligosaccharide-protein glycotransferase n=1 Tax=Marine Group III euryarchaeote CG-Epi6 TaxID=1889000 RepID=A0A1J5SME5_9ARCH|nr:MAG: hypothetical protein BEU03_01455 [Marine Group III euryarchaeote CG-Epi6]
MARQTRRRRDSKAKSRFKNRPTPSISRANSADIEKVGTSIKSSKIDWRTVGLLILIFVFSLYIRTAWTAEPATEDGYQLTGGSDPYYHKHVVDYVVENGEHLDRDPMLNYPYGANNNRPPLFDWSIAIVGLILSPFFSSTEDSVWWAMQVLPAIYGALIVFPVYAIGRAQFGKEAGLLGAFFIGVNASHVSHSSLALADHDSYIILFGTTAFFFFMRALTISNDRKWVSDWSDFDSIKQGLTDLIKSERIALGYAGLAGMTIAMVAMSWKGFPYIMAIIAIYLGFQMLVNAFRRVDSLTTGMLGLVTLGLPVLLSYPYYQSMGFISTWWEAPAYILLGYIIMSLMMVTTRDLPWLLVIGSSTLLALSFYLLLTYVFTELGFLLFSGQGYFVRTKLFNTIAEAQAPEFADFIFAFGPVSIWLGIFGVIWMAYQLFNQSVWKKDYLFVMIWALVSLFMAQSAVRFIFNATPVVSLISAWMTWLIIQWADFPSVLQTWTSYWGKRGNLFYGLSLLSLAIGFWFFFTISVLVGLLTAIILIVLIMVIGHMDSQDIDQYRFRDRISGLRKSFEMKRPLVALFVGLFILLPNTFYGYDAGVPYEDKKEHDSDIFNFLSYDFFRPEEFDYGQRNNVTLYPEGTSGMYTTNLSSNQLWYMGNTGPSFPSDYWIEGLEWLAEQDTEKAPEDRPGFMAWWDYGFWAIDIGEHPTVADNFQFGYQIAGNFLASQSEHEAMALLLYRILETEVDRDTGKFNSEVRTKILDGYLNEENVSAFEHIVTNPDDYIPKNSDGSEKDINKRNAAIRAGNPILMTMDINTVSDLLWEVEQITGKSIRYIAADTRMMAYGPKPGQTGILYAPVSLADYNINDFVEVQYTLSNGQTLPVDEINELVKTNPTLTIEADVLVYKERFLNSMFFRTFIGWSAPDIGRPIQDGIPGVVGAIAQEGKRPAPGWNMTHFKLVKSVGSQLNMLKYYDGATIQGTVATPNGDPVANANITILDEFGIPHGSATTDKNGNYSVLSIAGNVSVFVSLGNQISDDEKIRKVSNNILTGTTSEDLIRVNVSEEAAMRVPNVNSTFNIDIEIKPTNITGRLFWDMDKDGTFSGTVDEALPINPVKATNIRSEVETIVNTNANGKYEFTGLAPGEYTVTTVVDEHEVVLASYLGNSATRAGQDLEISEALKPGSIWGSFVSADEIGSTQITVSLYDNTNGTLVNSTFLNQNYLSSDCPDEGDTRPVSFCFEKLLPGNYTLRLENDGILADNTADWANNSIDVVLEKGNSLGYNATLRNGFRIEGSLTHNGEGISEEQISIRNVGFRGSYNVFTNENGYFATVLPEGTYDLFTLHQKGNNTLAYLERIDSNTVSLPIAAAMGPGYAVEGTLFQDVNANKTLDEGEKGFESIEIKFDSISGGTVSTTSTIGGGGEYRVVLPAGIYNAYALMGGEEGQNLVALQTVSLINEDNDSNISSNYGQNVIIVMYENHLGNEMPIEGLVNLDGGTTGALNIWATDPSSSLTLPIGDYAVVAEKYGYTFENIYEISTETNGSKEEITTFELNDIKELIVEMKRIPTTISGTFSFEDSGIANANISFSPVSDPLYSLNFSTDEDGNLSDVILPPDNYLYTFSYNDNGTRYFAAGQVILDIGQTNFDLGLIEAEKKYDINGLATLGGNPEDGMVTFTSVSDHDDTTTFEITKFEGYSGSLVGGNYYVSFQDAISSQHYSFIGTINLNGPQEYDLALKDEGYFRGEIVSSSDGDLIQDGTIEIQFESADNVIFVTETIIGEGLFGSTIDYGKIDLPNGEYSVEVDLEGYDLFEDTFTVNGDTEKYTISLDPIAVDVTLEVSYNNATGNKLPVSNADVRFTNAYAEYDQTFTTDENGTITISDMTPRTYEIEMTHFENGDDERFKLNAQNVYVKAGKEQQTFKRDADWRVKLSGTVFYDRDFNGVANTEDLLANSEIEIWNMAGTDVQYNTTADENGEYELYLYTGAYQSWIYTNEETSYVDIAELELEGALTLNASLNRGINFKQTYLSSVDSQAIDFDEIDMQGANFSFEIEMKDGVIDVTVPDGIYSIVSEYEDLSGTDDYVFNLNDNANITDDKDGILQNKTIERKLMRGIEVNVDRTEANVALGQTVTFNFNGTVNGHLNTIYNLNVDNIPSNWTAEFTPNKWGVNYGENVTSELKITPDQTVTVDEKETFSVTVSWTDENDNQVDDITHTFEIGVTPIEAQSPDFVVSELLWNPESPTVGTEVTLTAKISNLVNNTGIHSVPIAFYDGDVPMKGVDIIYAEFEGTDNEEVTVTAIWTATKGSHPLRVIIDPGTNTTLTEVDSTNNERSITISVSSTSEDDDNSFRTIALIVVGLVGGLAYVSYRSKRS